jgi:hypothetical protein
MQLAALALPSPAPAAVPELSLAQSARQKALIRMVVNPRWPGVRVPRSFVGFSFDYPQIPDVMGSSSTGMNTAGVQMFDNITRYGSGPPTIRIGGGFADEVWWNPNGLRPFPNGIAFDLGPSIIDPLGRFAAATGSRLIMGLNLAHPDHSIARNVMLALRDALGARIAAFEVGNEPDIYSDRGYGTDSRGRPKKARRTPYTFGEYLRDFRARAKALKRADPRAPLAGPSACCEPAWFAGAPRFLRREARRIRLMTYHQYMAAACPGVPRRDPNFLTLRRLLGNRYLAYYIKRFSAITGLARQWGKRVRVTESNSASCGGRKGASDTFASALWALDWMFFLHLSGAAGVDFHTAGIYYRPFAFSFLPEEQAWGGITMPLYYATLLFARATAGRARLIPRAAAEQRLRAGANVRAWPTMAPNGEVRVTVLNKDLRDGGRVVVRIPGRRAVGSLVRLTAPGVRSVTGIKLAGQTMPFFTRDGRLIGEEQRERVPRRGRSYVFRVPKASAALLVVPR